ncbi:MAG: 4-hydroxythreonine-4-phosphate dehydrogenase PdxA [Myxococcales bacterium]|nr:4-hydroxythreonine-4-phosphate dehydrogenase PdxA [Myxococcales bacterium]
MGISAGDPSGVGPEVLAKALASPKVRRALVPLVFGDASLAKALGAVEAWGPSSPRPSSAAFFAVSHLAKRDRRPGHPTRAGGWAQLDYAREAISAARRWLVDALCTAPVSKEAITRAGVRFLGHTELLATSFGCRTLMLMAGPRLKVALATNHLPLAEVSGALSVAHLAEQLLLLSHGLSALVGRKPRIAVCALNPHAGEGGLLGREELTIISPAIRKARRRGVDCRGPFSADGLFALAGEGRFPYDAALAMFHDQGLVAAKALDFRLTVNVTLGLPLPRTSPDHGVAYDIAGKGRADWASMEQALLMAAKLAHRWPS